MLLCMLHVLGLSLLWLLKEILPTVWSLLLLLLLLLLLAVLTSIILLPPLLLLLQCLLVVVLVVVVLPWRLMPRQMQQMLLPFCSSLQQPLLQLTITAAAGTSLSIAQQGHRCCKVCILLAAAAGCRQLP
jgi:hypothetical protein